MLTESQAKFVEMDQRFHSMKTAMEALSEQATANSNSLTVMNTNMDALRSSMLAMERMLKISIQGQGAQTGNPPGHGKGTEAAMTAEALSDEFADRKQGAGPY